MTLDNRSKYLRKLIIDMIRDEKRGHIGPAFSLVEIIRVLYDNYLNVTPNNCKNIDRDRLILSKGHGCLALYALLYDKGFINSDELLSFGKPTSILGGHPEYGKVRGIEASTGSLGHGLSIGVGFALSAKIINSSYKTVVIVGDGELNEGSNWEAALSATKHKLNNLTVMIDYNKMQSYGFNHEVVDLESLKKKFEAFGFYTLEANGHDITDIANQLAVKSPVSTQPKAIICHTVKGKGLSFAENSPDWHHKNSISENQIQDMYAQLES